MSILRPVRSCRMIWPLMVLVLLALAPSGIWALTVTQGQAGQVAQNFVNYILTRDGSWAGSKTPSVVSVNPLYHGAVLVGFVAAVSPSGFVLVPAEDELPAVKAFSKTDYYKLGGDFDDWVGAELQEIVTALRADRSIGTVFGSQNRLLWIRFDVAPTRFQAKAETAPGVVSPTLLATTWDQGDGSGMLYNSLCPQVNGVYCPVGCVATATSQLMRFWNYPISGQGSHSYTWNGQTLSADFSKTYDWADMPDSLTIRSTTAQKTAVATLCYDVAVAFEMDFDPEGSGAYTDDAQTILPTYFKYSSDVKVKSYTGSDSSWFPYFTQQVDIQRPLLLSIQGTSGGHAVVVDGYSTDTGNMVHINMGWGGMDNGYYALNDIEGNGFSFKDVNSENIVYDVHPGFEATISAYPPAGGAPLTVNFTGGCIGGTAPFSYDWDFGDGSAHGSSPTATHTYTSTGTFTCTLKTTDSTGNQAVKKATITVSGSGVLTANAGADKTSGQAPLAVQFTATASGGSSPYAYDWDFGDGSAHGSSQNLSHTYATGGTFHVTLKVTDGSGASATDTHLAIQTQVAIAVSSMAKAGSPFRFNVIGSNFVQGVQVFIGTDTVAWSSVTYKKSTKLVIGGGSALKSKVPKGTPTIFKFVNPDGGQATYNFTW